MTIQVGSDPKLVDVLEAEVKGDSKPVKSGFAHRRTSEARSPAKNSYAASEDRFFFSSLFFSSSRFFTISLRIW